MTSFFSRSSGSGNKFLGSCGVSITFALETGIVSNQWSTNQWAALWSKGSKVTNME